jgi:putative transposase
MKLFTFSNFFIKYQITLTLKTQLFKSIKIWQDILPFKKGGHAVKKSRFTKEQIAFALKQAGTGTRIDEICRKMGISDDTFTSGDKSMVG